MRILNLYAGIGGNRKLWGDEHEVVAVEIDPLIAAEYKRQFPKDTVVVGDAHQYLIDHFQEFDFIWSSPPCPTHSRVRHAFAAHGHQNYIYPDMALWQEILFLKHHARCKWVVENVVPYYTPLIKEEAVRGRHMFWANFHIDTKGCMNYSEAPLARTRSTSQRYGFDVAAAKLGKKKQAVLKNLVKPEIGQYILERAFRQVQVTL